MPVLPTDNVVHNGPTRGGLGGTQILYRVGDYGLSVLDSPILHSYPFAWEIAVIRFRSEDSKKDFDLLYDTPLTDDVKVFFNDEDASDFINRAFDFFREVQP
jgi:hypothetical protein